MQLSSFFKQVGHLITDNSPGILTAFGAVGVLSTSVLAVKATPEALRQISDASSERIDPLTKTEIVRLVWKEYVPAGVTAVVSIASIIGVNAIHSRRQALLLSLYTLSEKALEEYQSKVKEIVGEKKETAIRDEIAADRLAVSPTQMIYMTTHGDSLCYDTYSDRKFRSSVEAIRKAMNDVNFRLNQHHQVSHNEFYNLIGLPTIKYGEDCGWDVERGQLDVNFSSQLDEDTNEPCIVIDYKAVPINGYWHQNR